jgi:hypothetical protein
MQVLLLVSCAILDFDLDLAEFTCLLQAAEMYKQLKLKVKLDHLPGLPLAALFLLPTPHA